MNIENPLSFLYEEYRDGNLTSRDLEARIFRHIMESCDDEYGLYFRCRSDRIDFLCWFYPRMRGIIERYNQNYSSFDAYVASTLYYSYRSYKERRKRHAAAENACWKASNSGSLVCESETPEAMCEESETPSGNYKIKSPKYVLLILLKSYYYVSDALINKAASALNMTPEDLGKMVDTLHELQIEKIERRRRLVSASHCLYNRCLNYERQLASKIENVQVCNSLVQRLERSRRRLTNMRERLKYTRIEATNSDLAKLLGVPKGTIDSRLATIKSKMSANDFDF
ncbi:MAG: hypothetical protein LBH18_01195 [Spirochaetaceae bacterium]|jgi:hypothetical protein|nr:hypothetical protein [Spirochaetaceae bacterium]